MENIKIYKRPKLKSPYLLCAWPGMGEVAFKAASYLVEKLKAEPFAEIMSENFFYLTESIVEDGVLKVPELPTSKFYYWKNKSGKNDLIIFVSNAQPDLSRAEEYSKRIISVARAFGAKTVVSLAAMPQPIDHTQAAQVWFVATSRSMNELFKRFNLNHLSQGQISGMNGLFLGIAKREKLEGFCLLGEIPLYTIQIENPKASYAVLEVLSRIMNIQLDFGDLIEQIHTVEQEINKLIDYLKIGTPVGPISDEDIEKIKKSLSSITKLPPSVKEKIEKLFADAGADISKANELKVELDKWSVYKDYEDRFLDLFKKTKGN